MLDVTMLGSDGPRKAAAPSIWSFDSGYGSVSYDLPDIDPSEVTLTGRYEVASEEPPAPSTSHQSFKEPDNVDIKFGNFWNVHVRNQVHVQQDQPTINPIVTRLSVISSKDCSRTNSFFVAPGTPEKKSCVACDLWNITNPGENIKCTDCDTSKVAQHSKPVPKKKDVKPELPKLDIPKSEQRCSACELSALISPKKPSKCPSCLEKRSKAAAEPQPAEEAPKVRRSRAGRSFKLPLSALTRLQAWLDEHQNDPYPSADEKRRLAEECGITEKQVTTWFTNARARQLNPMETWLTSSSDDDAAPESAVERAASGVQYSMAYSQPLSAGTLSSLPGAPSLSGSSVGLSSPQSPLVRRQGSNRRGKKKNYRRGAQAPQLPTIPALPHPPSQEENASSPHDTWQCTFCLKHLSPKSWRRHEETQHLPRVSWTCMLSGPRLEQNHTHYCAFCLEENPSDGHFADNHRISECVARPSQDRTFYRPDHLRQHIKNYHGAPLHDLATTHWKKAADSVAGGWRCGFCGDNLSTWDVRETHIANHYRDGMKMTQWTKSPISAPSHDFEALSPQDPIRRPKTPRMPLSPYHNTLSAAFSPSPTVSPINQGITHSHNSSTNSLLTQQSPYAQAQHHQQPLLTQMNYDPNFLMDTCGNALDYNITPLPITQFTSAAPFPDLRAWANLPDLSDLPPEFGNPLDGDFTYDQLNDQFMDPGPPWNTSGP